MSEPSPSRSRRPRVLQVLHGGAGGLGLAVDLLMEQTSAEVEHWLLRVESGRWTLQGETGPPRRLLFRDAWALARLVRRLRIARVHVHHVLGDRRRLLRALRRLPVSYGVTIHDFYLPCPRIHMVPPGAVYCGAPRDPARCRACLRRTPVVDRSIDSWRENHGRFLRDADFITVPTAHTAGVLQRYWPDLEFRVVPHVYRPRGLDTAPVAPQESTALQIGVVGALGPEKGGVMVERMAQAARARNLPLRLVVLGDTHRHGGPQSLMDGWLFVHGSYRREELPELLRQYNIRITAFPVLWPETFCLTLSEVWACGLPALVPAFGALSERVDATGGGEAVEHWGDPDAWLDALLRSAREPEKWAAMGARGRESLRGASPVIEWVRTFYS